MEKVLRILYINGGLIDRGGISSFMLNHYLYFDLHKVVVDFVVHGFSTGERDGEIICNGGIIYNVTPKSKDYIKNYREIKTIITNGNYDIVHAHMDAGNAHVLKIAKECGVPIRISHSHSTGYTMKNKIRMIYNDFQKRNIKKYATDLWACSADAGFWLYGNKSKFEIVPNAINIEAFAYNELIRNELRQQLGLKGRFVIGHIGRFNCSKNQVFLLGVIQKLIIKIPTISLLFIGDGPDKQYIENRVQEMNLNDNVLFLGERNDVNRVMNVFDVFVLPSLFEGFGIVAIEAQSNGLKCFCSENITKEVDLTGNVSFLPLVVDVWVEALSTSCKRFDVSTIEMKNSDYDISIAAIKLQEKYFQLLK